VPSTDEILRQLEWMIFGDENIGKSKPKSNSNIVGKKKQKEAKEES
jgi:hypothetical protein